MALLKENGGEHSSLNEYLTFYNSLEVSKNIFSHDISIKTPDEECDVQTVEIDFSGDDATKKQMIEKILVRLDGES
jgi:hypothetical protein